MQPDVLSAVKESAAQKRDNSPGIEIINYPRTQRVAYTIAPFPFYRNEYCNFQLTFSLPRLTPRFFLPPFVSAAKPPRFRHDLCRCFLRLARNLRTRSVEVAVSRTAATRGCTRLYPPNNNFRPSKPVLNTPTK